VVDSMADERDRNLYDGSPDEVEGHRFIVDRMENSMDEHDLWIGGDRDDGHYVCLQRGILRGLSRASVDKVARSLHNLTQGKANHYMEERGITYFELGIVLAHARIKEMAEFEDHFLREIGELREELRKSEDAQELAARLDRNIG